jgi:methyl-accepting chemotaxis protein
MKISELEQGSRAFKWQYWKIDVLSPIPAFILTLVYLGLMFDLELSEGLTLAGCLVGSAIVAGLVAEAARRPQAASIIRYLDQNSGEIAGSSTAADPSQAFLAIMSLPMRMQRMKIVAGLASIVVTPPLMWAAGFDVWLGGERVRSVATIILVGSLLSGTLVFYWAKHAFVGLRSALASVAGDSTTRAGLAARLSLQRKLLFAIAVPACASVLLIVDVVDEDLRSSTENEAAAWAMLAVESIADANAELALTTRIAIQLPQEKFWPTPLDTLEIRADGQGDTTGVDASDAFLDALDRKLEQGRTSGLVVAVSAPEIGAFRRLEDGTILLSKISRADFERDAASLSWAVGLVFLGVLTIGVLIGRLAASEFTIGLEKLEAAANRLASGDLALGIAYESEDELGDMGRALASVGDRLRSTVARVSSTAENAERSAEKVSAALVDVTATGEKQVQQMQRANQVITAITARVDEASQFAANLKSAIELSGNSLLELGATGDELNETASVLTSKVDEVSESLEQMVQSVKQVAGTSGRLAAASEETSSSMEEMASAMRAVDTSAETTANLSREVVSKAELGQAKVVQTIAGMEAIREATDVAEHVIRGLGARTNEIGGILDVIDDVADETNLLALNAAIIAAQAGEHGKAFSVVADEIKELADRVLASTKEIGGLIRAVQEESENAIGAIEAGSESVMSGVDLSAEAGRTLEEITVASRESGLRIGEIVASVREQTKAASHVVGLMERVRESAEEIGLAGSQQDQGNEIVYRSALAMREVAQQVRHTTEEQTAGFGRIRENVVGVREAVDQIAGSLGEQTGACRQVTEFLERVSQGTQSNEEAAEKLRETMREFISQAVSLREDAERFRV